MTERREKVPRMRKVMGENLRHSVTAYPHIRGFMNVDMENLLVFKEELKAQGKKVSITVLIAKAVALTMMAFPQMNVRVDDDEFIFYDTVNVGIAVQSAMGLFVPVLRDVQLKPLTQLAEEFAALQAKLEKKTITMDDLVGSTITISSISGGRFDAFTSIINNHESLLIGVARTRKEVAVNENDEIYIRKVCTICVNANHFSTDGQPASAFGARLCEILENPAEYLME